MVAYDVFKDLMGIVKTFSKENRLYLPTQLGNYISCEFLESIQHFKMKNQLYNDIKTYVLSYKETNNYQTFNIEERKTVHISTTTKKRFNVILCSNL